MLTIDEKVRAVYPGAKMGIMVIKDISYSSLIPEPMITEFRNNLYGKYAHLERNELKKLYPVDVYITYYKKFGYNYHLLAQLESVLKGKKSMKSASGLLLAMFLSELDGMLLTAGHDFTKLQLPLQLKIADGTEFYQSISEKEVVTVKNDLILCDSKGPVSSILRGPDYKSRITSSTTEVLFSIYAPPDIDADYIKDNLLKLEKSISTLSLSSRTDLLQVFF